MSSTQVATPADVSWGAAGNNSNIVDISGRTICGFYIPSGFSGTTLKLKATYSNGRGGQPSPVTVIDSTGADVSYTVAAGRYLRVAPADFAGIDAFQLVSNASEAANTVVKVASRNIA